MALVTLLHRTGFVLAQLPALRPRPRRRWRRPAHPEAPGVPGRQPAALTIGSTDDPEAGEPTWEDAAWQ